ncbi:MAG: hypothetical protein QF718_07855 [Phycisphaerales bacterium]|jgi:hypothetical protein|nr:hypothetical protein [Phycisphaerales bacterium]
MPLPSTNLSNPVDVCDTLQTAANLMTSYSGRIGCSHHIPSSGGILVSGDLHDNPFNLEKIIKLASLNIPTNHVVLQELIHSKGADGELDLSYRMLVRVASLVLLYPSQVHPILANHELSQLTRREITKGAGELVAGFINGVEHVFGKSSQAVLESINRFIISMPLAVRSESGLMCTHSLPDEHSMDYFDMDILERNLNPLDYTGSSGSAYSLVWGRTQTEEQINELAQHWGVKLFCLGHAWVPEGIEVAAPNVLLLNSDHDQGVALPLSLDNIQDANTSIKSALKLINISVDSGEL